MKDLRTEFFTFPMTDKKDIETVYRELCKVHKMSITAAKAFSDAQKGFSIHALIKLCIHFNLKLEMDAFKDEITIWYPEVGSAPAEIILDKKTEEIIEGNNPAIAAAEAEQEGDDDDTVEKFTYKEIKKEPLIEPGKSDADDMF